KRDHIGHGGRDVEEASDARGRDATDSAREAFGRHARLLLHLAAPQPWSAAHLTTRVDRRTYQRGVTLVLFRYVSGPRLAWLGGSNCTTIHSPPRSPAKPCQGGSKGGQALPGKPFSHTVGMRQAWLVSRWTDVLQWSHIRAREGL